jgi:hypothetical protein
MKIHAILAFSLFCTALVPAVARADSQQDQQACMNDAMTICSQFIPDRERVAGCLISNRTKVSEACRTALTRFNAKNPHTAAAGGAR